MAGAAIDQAALDVLGRHWHPVARSDAIDADPVGVGGPECWLAEL